MKKKTETHEELRRDLWLATQAEEAAEDALVEARRLRKERTARLAHALGAPNLGAFVEFVRDVGSFGKPKEQRLFGLVVGLGLEDDYGRITPHKATEWVATVERTDANRNPFKNGRLRTTFKAGQLR